MTTPIKVPELGESVTEATVAKWLVQAGDYVAADAIIAELETDKVNMEVTAPKAGKITAITTEVGSTVKPGDAMGELDESAQAPKAEATTEPQAPSSEEVPEQPEVLQPAEPAAPKSFAPEATVKEITPRAPTPMPAAITAPQPKLESRREPLSRIRKSIAANLKEAQNTAAMLTTYNEVDMSAIMALRASSKQAFQDKHGVKLGFMGFFTKAVCTALAAEPKLNAALDGDEVVYHGDCNIGIAVSSARGLLVPVVRQAQTKTLADIERDIADFGTRARDGKVMPDELSGGTFTITNGGVFGSMLSMPILNHPQVGILGMHNIVERPVAVNGRVEIRPIMYVALTYDHRLVDGKEAVTFLKTVKDHLEQPGKFLL